MTGYRVASQSLTHLPRSVQNRAYLKFIRELPCLVCARSWGIEAAHTGARGLGTKASDLDAIPLCGRHHQHGPWSYHKLGRRNFERYHRLNLRTIIASLQKLAAAEGLDLSRDDTPKKQPGRATGLKSRRGVA